MSFALLSNSLYSQTDSISYCEEKKESSDYNYRKTYQYLDIKLKNEIWLLKVSPFFNIRNSMEEFSLELAFERKLSKAFSMQIFTKTQMGSGILQEGINGNLSMEIRYYPGIKKRIAKGLSGNNMSGYYLSVGIPDLIKYTDEKNSNYKIYFYNWAYPNINMGYQSRLSNWAYLDVFAIFSYKSQFPNYYNFTSWGSTSVYSTLGFRLGFAWGK